MIGDASLECQLSPLFFAPASITPFFIVTVVAIVMGHGNISAYIVAKLHIRFYETALFAGLSDRVLPAEQWLPTDSQTAAGGY